MQAVSAAHVSALSDLRHHEATVIAEDDCASSPNADLNWADRVQMRNTKWFTASAMRAGRQVGSIAVALLQFLQIRDNC